MELHLLKVFDNISFDIDFNLEFDICSKSDLILCNHIFTVAGVCECVRVSV